MNICITPHPFGGILAVPSSKSLGHRDLICAALAEGESLVEHISASEDIDATCRVLRCFGAEIEEVADILPGRISYRIQGGIRKGCTPVTADCGESGSTLRFLIPLGLLTGRSVTYIGRGRLVSRPLQPYYAIFRSRHIAYQTADGGGLPLTVTGTLSPGAYTLPGNVSSQFFTGLLLTLPLLAGDSSLYSSTTLKSASYVGLTLDTMARHGVHIEEEKPGVYQIAGGQSYRPGQYEVEGDYSQAAFWLAAGCLGHDVKLTGLRRHSAQGDEVIIDIIRRMGGRIDEQDGLTARPSSLKGTIIDAGDCPDLVPVLTVLATAATGTTHIVNAARVRLKECDRLHAMAEELNKLGGRVTEEPDGLIIEGTGHLHGGRVQAWNDHRIAMSLAVASQIAEGPVQIDGAECVKKSYPRFWQDVSAMGGMYTEEAGSNE